MTKSEMFCYELKAWCANIGIDTKISLQDNFTVNAKTNEITFGMIEHKDDEVDFEQFLYEYGCDYIGIFAPVRAFLHECGHAMTLYAFSNEELIYNHYTCMYCDTNFEYWETPIEFSANMWVIDFINNAIDRVEELLQIVYNYLDDVNNEYFKEEENVSFCR